MQSSEVITPLAIQTPIAVNGDKNIPSQSASGTDTSSINLGFLPITSEPLDDGGVAPERIDFNGMFYLSTDQRVFLQNGGVITYDSTVATKIGGYPAGAILGYTDSLGNYGFVTSLVENNQYNFVTTPSYIDGEKWEWVSLKADLSNMNPTQTVKNTIIGWGLPDYSNATSISYSSGNAIGFNGYLAITGRWQNKDTWASLYINNCLIMRQSSANDNGNSQSNHNSVFVNVSSTDIITWTNYTASNLSFSSIPFKGGN